MADDASSPTVEVIPQPPELYAQKDDTYRSHPLEQSKSFIDVTLKYWGHNSQLNRFFPSCHTILLSGFTYLFLAADDPPRVIVVALLTVAMVFALQWFVTLHSWHRLNDVRHEIVQEMERQLPARPYRVEYDKLIAMPSWRYIRIQRLYMAVPVIIFVIYLLWTVLILLDFRIPLESEEEDPLGGAAPSELPLVQV